MPRRVIVLISSPIALRVVATMWGDSGWQFNWGQTGKVGKEACDTLQLMAGLLVDILMLDISLVVVVSAVEVVAVILMFQSMSPSQMTASSRDEIVELVGGVERIVDEGFQFERSQSEGG
jgi:hypothetical protein